LVGLDGSFWDAKGEITEDRAGRKDCRGSVVGTSSARVALDEEGLSIRRTWADHGLTSPYKLGVLGRSGGPQVVPRPCAK